MDDADFSLPIARSAALYLRAAYDYLTNPVTHEDLLAAVKARILRQRAHEDERQSHGMFKPDFTRRVRSSAWG